MFGLLVKRDFVSRHYLVGGDWGEENRIHSHHYELEVEMERESLDEHNYLLDIVFVGGMLDGICSYFRDKTLNDLPEFKDTNPSIEFFSRVIWEKISGGMQPDDKSELTVRLWENRIARASYRNFL